MLAVVRAVTTLPGERAWSRNDEHTGGHAGLWPGRWQLGEPALQLSGRQLEGLLVQCEFKAQAVAVDGNPQTERPGR